MDEALQLDQFGDNDVLCEEVGGDDTGVVVGDMAYMHDEHLMLQSGADEMGLDMSEYEVGGVGSDMPILGGQEEVLTLHTTINNQQDCSEPMEVEESPLVPVAFMQSQQKFQNVGRVVSMASAQIMAYPIVASNVQVSTSRSAVREIAIAPKPQPVAPKAVASQGKFVAISSANAKRLAAGGKQLVMLGGPGGSAPRLKLLPGQTVQQSVVLPKMSRSTQLQRVVVQGAPEGTSGVTGGGVLARVVPANGGPPRFITLPPQQVNALTQQMVRVRQPATRQMVAVGQVMRQQPRFVSLQPANKNVVVSNAPKKMVVTGNTSQNASQHVVVRQSVPAQSQIHQISVPGKGVQYIRVVTPARSVTQPQSQQPPIRTHQKLVRIAPVAKSQPSQSLLSKLAVPTSPTKQAGSPTKQQQPRPVQSLLATRPQRPADPPAPTKQEVAELEFIIADMDVGVEESISVTETSQPLTSENIVEVETSTPPIMVDESKSALRNLVASIQQQQLQQNLQQHVEVTEVNAEFLEEDHTVEIHTEDTSASGELNTSGPYLPVEHGGGRPRKPCNCTKSQCLKLYCDCFANGEFCNSCNCANCHNNLEHESMRQRAIRTCLERNPNAFRPKIGKGKATGPEPVRRHNKGCNCKRSGCLKNYCECYEAKIACSGICRCMGCRNVEDGTGRITRDDIQTIHTLASFAELRPTSSDSAFRQPTSFMTGEVVEAVCQCLMAAGAAATGDPVAAVIDEFSRCLQDIIGASQHNAAGSAPSTFVVAT